MELGLETSLIETASLLFKILLGLVGLSLVLAIITLPLFYLVVGYKLVWMWSCESSGGIRRRAVQVLLRIGMPLLSLFATLFVLGYFGALDLPQRWLSGLPSNKKGPVQLAVEQRFDDLTRRITRKSAPLMDPSATIHWRRYPGQAEKLLQVYASSQAPPIADPLQGVLPPRPEGETSGPPESFGPQPLPEAVIAYVRVLNDAASTGSLVDIPRAAGAEPLSNERLREADDVYDGAIKEAKAIHDRKTNQIRGLGIYFFLLIGPFPLIVMVAGLVFGRRGTSMVMRNIVRSILRTSLTYLAVFVLVFMLCAIWSVLDFLSALTTQKDSNLRGIITEKFQIPSQMKPSHLVTVKSMLTELPADMRPDNLDESIMTWAFVGGTLDPTKRTLQNSIFFFALEPESVLTMMPGLEDLTGEERRRLEKATALMKADPKAVVIGADKLRIMGKRVGDRMKITSLNYKDLVFEFTIVEEFPSGTRWEQSAVMNRKYLDNEIDAYKGRNGRDHPLADKCMNLIWVRLPNQKAFEEMSERISDPAKFSPAIKMEIESSAYANFLSPFKTLVFFMRWVLVTGLIAIAMLVSSLVIGIGVRERRTEIAVLKVLGFRPWMVLALIIGEALLIGTMSGYMASATAYSLVNAAGGIPLPIGFFGKFFIPENALWWGPAIGAITSLVGSILPSIATYRIRASQVFSRVT